MVECEWNWKLSLRATVPCLFGHACVLREAVLFPLYQSLLKVAGLVAATRYVRIRGVLVKLPATCGEGEGEVW